MFEKGFLQGSQSHLNFLPEKQTDFIFTMLAEELGLSGALLLLLLYVLALGYGFAIALRCSSQLGSLALGTTTTVPLHVHQYCHGYGADTGCWCAVAPDFLWRYSHADGNDWIWLDYKLLRSS